MNLRNPSVSIMRLPSKIFRKKNSNSNITNVLIGSYVRTITISFILGIILFIAITGKELKFRRLQNSERILSIVTYIINARMDEVKKFCDELVIDNEFNEIFTRKEDIRNNLLGGYLMKKMAELDTISSIHIVMENSVVSEFKYPVYDVNPQDLINNLKLNSTIRKRGGSYWEIGTDNGITDANSFYFVVNIKSITNMKHLGYLVTFIDIDHLKRDITHYLQKETEIYIQSASGEIITFPDNIPDDTVIKVKKTINSEDKRLPDKYRMKEFPGIEGNITVVSNQSIYSPNVEFAIIFMLIIIIEFTIIASIVLKKRVIGPLEEIANRAKKIAVNGNLDIKFPNNKYYSEADDISKALNDMMTQIKGLLEDVKNKEKLQRQLELSVINHQIKPHFLYNTLNAASILISVEEKEAANQLIQTLASYYRTCLNRGNDIISLENDLKIVQDYIKIVLIRNPNILEYRCDVDDTLLNLQIPKMTLQTLVENSIKYGIREMGQPIKVTITATRKDGFAEITVEDDGIGISKDIIDRVMKGEQLDAKSGFGLKSVLSRLALLYEDKDKKELMEIQSEPNRYTRIILRLYFKDC